MDHSYRSLPLRLSGAAAALLMLAACASAPPPPTQSLLAAERAIAAAEQARVTDYAAAELGEARTKLDAARAAVLQEDMEGARRLAEESRVTAELASARADLAKSKGVNEDMKKGTATLKQEMQRSSGDQQ